MKKRALIIGIAGQDGTLLRELLARQAYEVTGLRRDDLDILDAAKVREWLRTNVQDEVYYLAAYHHSSESLPPSSGELFQRSMDVHFRGVVNFLQAMVDVAPASRFFFASSSHIFSAFDENLQTEATHYDPQSEYAITKVAGMQACRHYRRAHKLFASSGILYNHESPLRRHGFLAKKIAMAAAAIARAGQGTLEVGDMEAQVDWGAAVDYVDAIYRIVQAQQPDDYIVASGRLRTVREFVNTAFGYVGLDYGKHVISNSGVVRRNTGRRVGDSSKLRQATGWQPTLSFEQMVQSLVQFEIDALDAHARSASQG